MRRLEIWLNNESIRDAEPRVLLRNFRETAPEVETVFGENAGRDGQRLISRRRLVKEIQIDFQIRELYDMGARQEAIDSVNRWARDGILRTNTQPFKQIRVVATGWATMAQARDYTDTYTITFAALTPYWEDETPTKTTLTGTSAEGEILNGGSADTPVSVTITPAAGTTMSSATVTVGESTITVNEISATASAPLKVSYDDSGLMSIPVGTAGALSKRTAQSDDDLIAAPGVNDVSVETDVSVTAELTLRGRYK